MDFMLGLKQTFTSFFNRYVILLIMLTYGIIFLIVKKPGDPYDRLIINDGKGYYAYLPALFIYHDLEYKFAEYYESKYYPSDTDPAYFKEFRFKFRGETVNKTFIGIAVLMLPFFLIAHLLALLFGTADGYSMIYQYAIGFSVYFYLWLGLLTLRRLLGYFTENRNIISVILIAIALGTNIVYYTLVEGTMPHVYLFFLVNLFLLLAYRALHERQAVFYLGAAAAFGLILITRPQNGFIIFVLPFLAGSHKKLNSALSHLFSERFLFLKALTVLASVVMLQVVLWYVQTGYLLVYSYGEESFNFLNPQIANILWSFEKGWMVYTPLAFLAIAGVIRLLEKNLYQAISVLLLFLILIYVFSCWWVWHYTSQFGQRVFIDFYGLLAILVLAGFSLMQQRVYRIAYQSVLAFLIVLNLFQFHQQITWVYPKGPVTGQTYLQNFFRTTPQTSVAIPAKYISQITQFDFPVDPTFVSSKASDAILLRTLKLEPYRPVPVFSLVYGNVTATDETILNVSLEVWDCYQADLTLQIDFFTNGIKYSDYLQRIDINLQCYTLNHIGAAVFLPFVFDKNDSVMISLSSNSQVEVGIGNAFIEIMETKPGSGFRWITRPLNHLQSVRTLDCNMKDCDPAFILRQLSNETALNNNTSTQIDPSQAYGAGFMASAGKLFNGPNRALRIRAFILNPYPIYSAVLVTSIMTKNGTPFYRETPVELSNVSGNWKQYSFSIELPYLYDENQDISCYFWDKNPSSPWFIDSLCIDFITLTDRVVATPKIRPASNALIPVFAMPDTVLINSKRPFYGPPQVALSAISFCEPSELLLEASVISDTWFPSASLVMAHYSGDSLAQYQGNYFAALTLKNRWNRISFSLPVEACLSDDDSLRIYFWNPSLNEQILISDFNIFVPQQDKTRMID